MPSAARVQRTRTSVGQNSVITRQDAPITATAIVVEKKPTGPPKNLVVSVIPIRGGSTDARTKFLIDDPIVQLNRSINPPARQIPAGWNGEKSGDYEFFARDLDIIKTHVERQSQRRNIVKRAHDDAVIRSGSKAWLGTGLNGHAVYAAPRYKPALPDGRSDLPEVTGEQGYAGSYLLTTAPANTAANLNREDYLAKWGPLTDTLPVSIPDRVTVSVPSVAAKTATYNYTADDAKGTPLATETTGQSAGKLVFLLAAVGVAWLVLR